jgi:hypothetical protein
MPLLAFNRRQRLLGKELADWGSSVYSAQLPVKI